MVYLLNMLSFHSSVYWRLVRYDYHEVIHKPNSYPNDVPQLGNSENIRQAAYPNSNLTENYCGNLKLWGLVMSQSNNIGSDSARSRDALVQHTRRASTAQICLKESLMTQGGDSFVFWGLELIGPWILIICYISVYVLNPIPAQPYLNIWS